MWEKRGRLGQVAREKEVLFCFGLCSYGVHLNMAWFLLFYQSLHLEHVNFQSDIRSLISKETEIKCLCHEKS